MQYIFDNNHPILRSKKSIAIGFLSICLFISLKAHSQTIIPDVTILNGFSSNEGLVSTTQSVDITSANLTEDITITVPANFEISVDGGATFVTNTTTTVAAINTSENTYTATYTVAEGNTDRAANDDLPVNFILTDDAGNNSNTFAISQNADPIDANIPVFTSAPVTSVNDNEIYTYTITTEGSNEVTISSDNLPGFLSLQTIAPSVTTLAGSGDFAFSDNSDPLQAQFSAPTGVAVDASGNVFVADRSNHRIRRIDGNTGAVTTLAGSGAEDFSDNPDPLQAQFNSPAGVAVDASGNVFVADQGNDRIRRIDGSTGAVTTLAGSGAVGLSDNSDPLQAEFNRPTGVAVDASGNVFVADAANNRIRRIDGSTGAVTTLAGSGDLGSSDNSDPLQAQFNSPEGIAVDASGNVFAGDRTGHSIRRIDGSTGAVTTLAGSGGNGFSDNTDPLQAQFNSPTGVAVDASGNVFVADRNNNRIRRIDGITGAVTTLAGSGAEGLSDNPDPLQAQFNSPAGVALDASGNIFVGDRFNSRIRLIRAELIQITGDATGQAGTFPITLTADDGTGNTVDQSFTLTVNDITGSEFSSGTSVSFAENGLGIVYTAVATDNNANNTDIVFTLGNTGGDEGSFNMNNGALSFIAAPDFENPQDADGNNSYEIEILAADDADNETSLIVTITVTDVMEAPVFVTGASISVDENVSAVVVLEATDSDAGSTIEFSITGGLDESSFGLNESNLSFVTAPDFEVPEDSDGDNIYEVEVSAGDGTNSTSLLLTVSVTDVDDLVILSSVDNINSAIELYPNPVAEGPLTLFLPNKSADDIMLKMVNVEGLEMNFSLNRIRNTYTIGTNELPQGVYILSIMLEEEVNIHRRIIKL